jgi:TolB protein
MELTIIEELEYRYRILFDDFQAGKINERMFIVEVDKLQFKDDWSRYWMLGAQTGAWHYYDGQTWHQADPRDANELPFMDDQGRYWQRGTKSGNWYYYQAETGEWVKPGEGDPPGPAPIQQGQSQVDPVFAPQSTYDQAQPQSTETGVNAATQFEAELFQDDEGRYWTIGSKTGQWYFYDDQGWHPADEFQTEIAAQGERPLAYQPQQSTYTPHSQQIQPIHQTTPASQASQVYGAQPQQPPQTRQGTHDQFTGQQSASRQSVPLAQPQPAEQQTTEGPPVDPTYATQPQQPDYQQPASQPQTAQGYATAPVQNTQTPEEWSGSVSSVEHQPQRAADPGVQTESAAQPPSGVPPVSRTPDSPQGTTQSGTWFYFDGEQWLKYSSGEPAEEPPPDPRMILDQKPGGAKAESKSEPIVAEFFEDDEPPIEVVDVEVITVIEAEPDEEPEYPNARPTPKPSREPASVPTSMTEEVRPRRSKPAVEPPAPDTISSEPERQSRRRSPSDPGRPVTPRKKPAAHEPTIIIPTGATVSGTSSSSARVTRPPKQRTGSERRRAREDTAPMEPVSLPTSDMRSTSDRSRHRQVTQALPKITHSPSSRAGTGQKRTLRQDRQVIEEIGASLPEDQSAQPLQSQKEGFTLGYILRSFPSTFWTVIAGVATLLMVAVLIIGATKLPLGISSVGPVQSPTPTLDAALPDSTPTPGPTPTLSAEAVATPTLVSVANFNSVELGLGLAYPEDWLNSEDDLQVIFSPSDEGLDPEEWKDTSIRVGRPDDSSSSISDLLTWVLARFPPEAETLNEGTISIASQTWTSTQIRFEDENLGGRGIATLAVTNKDGKGYFLIALAPAEEWNGVQPLFQEIINSFEFTQLVALATVKPTSQPTGVATTDLTEDEQPTVTSTSTPTEEATVAPELATTPVVYIVQPGDTLLAIAVNFGVDVDLLAAENGITDPGSLGVDQELTIPFTAEELAAYNTSGGTQTASPVDTSSESPGEATDTAEAISTEADSPETTSAETEAVSEEPVPPSDAAAVSGRIVYPAFNPSVNNYDVWMVNIATGEQIPVASESSQPAFNKDGSLLAYRSWGLSTRGIFFRDFVGGRGGKVTNFGEDGLPTWSPDGFTFTFSSRKEGDRVSRIYVGNQEGGESFGLSFQGEYPATFPDGRLVIKGCTPTGDCGIFVMGASGGGETKISGDGGDTAPAPSPDGSKVALMSIGRGGSNWEIWVVNADGSDPKRLTENNSNEGLPTWSPDGQSIAYVSDQGGAWAIWVMNADGSNQRKLADMKGSPDGKVLHDEFNSRGWLEERISWAP